ncbi:MAG TPA: hypothetical protein VGH22_17875 [Candidatus Binatia bacterium]
MTQHILRIDCPDEPGLVHKIIGVLFNGGYRQLTASSIDNLGAIR